MAGVKPAAALKRAKDKKWEDLLAYHLQINGLGKLFAREYIIPELGRKWRWDFCDPMNKVAIEVQGAIWVPNKAHSGGTGIMRDHAKANAANFHGYAVFAFSDKTIKSLEAVDLIRDYYRQRLKIEPGSVAPF